MRPYNKDTDFNALKAKAVELATINADSPRIGTAMLEQMLPPMRAVRFVREAGEALGITIDTDPEHMPAEFVEIFEACVATFTGGKCGMDFADNLRNIQPSDLGLARLLNAATAPDINRAPGSNTIH